MPAVQTFDYPGWTQTTGFDSQSQYLKGRPKGTQVIVRPNQYEPGRANLIVLNWDKLAEVAVDVSSVLTTGTPYEVRNVQDYFGATVLRGVYHGQPLRLPMTGLSIAQPVASRTALKPSGPELNVFILIPTVIADHAAVTPAVRA
jgi:hypothetical protein